MSNPIILNNDQISGILTIPDCIEIIENLFQECYDHEHCGLIQMPPKIYLDIPNGDFRAMPAPSEKYSRHKVVRCAFR